MEFILLPSNSAIPSSNTSTAFLKIDNWNDYSFVTQFSLSVRDEKGVLHNIGKLKIGFKGQTIEKSTHGELESNFTTLSGNFFSAGNSVDYYNTLNLLSETLKNNILNSLRDLSYIPSLIEYVKGETVFKHSLLRDISLTTLKGKYARVIARMPELSNFNFSFKRLASEDLASIDLDFKVTENSKPSTNIHALIGRNGSGKTTIIKNLGRKRPSF